MSDSDFRRTAESPFAFARLRALVLAPSLGIDSSVVNEAFGILGNAFGVDWLNEAADDMPRGRALPFRRNPIGDLVSTAGLLQLSELVELAGYLGSLSRVRGSGHLIPALKSSYRQTLFQVAFASLALEAGASIECLEPASDGGKLADIDLRIGASVVRVECFRPTYKAPDENDRHLIAFDALDALKGSQSVYAIAVVLKVEPTPVVRRHILGKIRTVIGSLAAKGFALEEDDEALISVCTSSVEPAGTPPRVIVAPGFPDDVGSPPVFVRQSVGNARDLQGLWGDTDNGEYRSSIAVWIPQDSKKIHSLDQPLETPLLRLGRKIEAKLIQARGPEGAVRIMTVDSWLTTQLHRASPDDIERMRRKIVEAHRGVGALLLMKRDEQPLPPFHPYLLASLLSSTASADIRSFTRVLAALPKVKPAF